jgi:hypothetical protein
VECFYHDGRQAVSSCRACLRGLCRECGTDLGRGLACRGRCEPAVRDLIATLEQSIRYRGVSGGILQASRTLWSGLAVIALLVGAFVGVWGLTLPAYREISLLGLPFLLVGALTLRVARSVRSGDAGGAPEREPAA